MIKMLTSKWLLALGCLAVFSVAMAADPPPSGTVKLTSKSIAVGVGVTWGDGTLTFGGKTYTFSVEGLGVADLGVSDVTTSGEVFNLKDVPISVASTRPVKQVPPSTKARSTRS